MAHVAGVLYRAIHREESMLFYRCIGLSFKEHRHGGPIHYACTDISEEVVFEIYSETKNFESDVLMIEVESIQQTLNRLSGRSYIDDLPSIKQAGDIRFSYIEDPDNRKVMLMERSS